MQSMGWLHGATYCAEQFSHPQVRGMSVTLVAIAYTLSMTKYTLTTAVTLIIMSALIPFHSRLLLGVLSSYVELSSACKSLVLR